MPKPTVAELEAPQLEEAPIAPNDPKNFTPEPFSLDLSDPSVPFIPPAEGKGSATPTPPPLKGEAQPPGPAKKPDKNHNPLREAVETANAELKKLREEREKEAAELRQQLEEERKQREALAAQHQTAAERLSAMEKERGMEDPRQAPEVRALSDPWNDQANRLARDLQLAGAKGDFRTGVKDLIDQFGAIGEPSTPGYEERREAFQEAVSAYGPDHVRDIRRLVADGFELRGKISTVIEDISKNSDDYRYRREQKMWEEIERDYANDEAGFFKPAPELKETDPFNAHVLVTEMMSSSDEGKKRLDQIRKWSRFTLLPPAPISPSEMAKMTVEEQALFMEKRIASHAAAQKKLRNILPVALASQALLPTVIKRNQELEEELKTLRGITPRPPAEQEHGGVRQPGAGSQSIKDFVPTNDKLAGILP